MPSEEEIKKVFVGKNILVQDKTFSIVDAGIQQGRIFFRVSCEGMQDIIDAEATEDNYLELYNRMIQSQREQKPESQQQVTDQSQTRPVESVLKEIEPELKFVYERKYKQKAIGIGFVMIGKVLNERPNKFGITLDEARKAWNSLENLKKDIKINGLSQFVRRNELRLNKDDAPNDGNDAHSNPFVDRRLDILSVIEYALMFYRRLENTWKDNTNRVNKLIKAIKEGKGGSHFVMIGLSDRGFKKVEDAQPLYSEILSLTPKKLKSIFKIRGKEGIKKNAKEILRGYMNVDVLWWRNWETLAMAIYLINHSLILKINQAVAQSSGAGRRQQRTIVPETASPEVPLEEGGE